MVRRNILKLNSSLDNILTGTLSNILIPADLRDAKVAQCSAFASLELVVTNALSIPEAVKRHIQIDADIFILI